MTEIQSDEAQEANGEDQAELRPQTAWEQYGMSQEDYLIAAEPSYENAGKLRAAEEKVRKARELLQLLIDADAGNTTGDYDLSCRALSSLDQAQSLLKSAAKKIDKYGNEQKIRDIENWKQRGAS